jgi:hypothetical protein
MYGPNLVPRVSPSVIWDPGYEVGMDLVFGVINPVKKCLECFRITIGRKSFLNFPFQTGKICKKNKY